MNVPLQKWANENEPEERMCWKQSWWAQIMFVRDHLASALSSPFQDWRATVDVVSTHTSKSIVCPVYFIEVPRLGLKLWARYNFHDWNVSVEADRPISHFDFLGIVKPNDEASYGYCFCQGMDSWRFDMLGAGDPTKFTARIGYHYDLYAFAKAMACQLAAERGS